MNPLFPQTAATKVANIWQDDYALSDEGGFFTTVSASAGTATAGTICVDDAATGSSTHAQFAPALLIYNGAVVNDLNAPNIYMKYIKFIVDVAPASATGWFYSLRIENANRYSSGGSALTPTNGNPMSSKASKATIYAGAIVPTGLPGSTSRLISTGIFTGAIPVVKDQYLMKFGNSEASMDQINNGSGTKNITLVLPPVVLPPGWALYLEAWGPSNSVTPWSFDVEIGHVERPAGL